MGIEHVHRKSDAERRADARQEAASAARRGESPSSTFPAADVAWAFEGFKDELDELEQLAIERRAAIEASREAASIGRELARETERVLEQWDEQARVERRKLAQQEARKRLGL